MNMQDRQNIKKEYCLSVPAHDRDLAVAAFRAWLAFETRPRHWNVPAVLAWLGFNVVPFSPDNTDNTDPAAIRSTFDGQTDVQQTRNEAERREDSLSLSLSSAKTLKFHHSSFIFFVRGPSFCAPTA